MGRLKGLTRRRLDQRVRAHGGRLAARASARVTTIAFGHSAVSLALDDGRVQLPTGLPATASLISENALRRQLGLLEPPPAVDRSLGRSEIERLAGLAPDLLACLVLFDVLEPVEERFAYRDLVAARETARLLKRGVALGEVLDAAIALGRRGGHLSEARLTEGPAGALLREFAGQLAELSGQLTLRLPMHLEQKVRNLDDLLAEAELAAERDDHATAESLYTTAMRADTADPVLPFNLGNVFQAQGRTTEAKVAWQIAVARDPAFAEAWYNLALAAAHDNQADLAVAQYRRAVQAEPDYADAQFNLALLLTELDRCSEALAAWQRFLELEPTSKQAGTAHKAIALCRMRLQQERTQAGQGTATN